MLFCPKCGTEILANTDSCKSCGYRFGVKSPNSAFAVDGQGFEREEYTQASAVTKDNNSAAKKKGALKRFLSSKPRAVIAIILVLAIVGGTVFGAVSLIKRSILKQHPFGYVYTSYKNYYDHAIGKSEAAAVLLNSTDKATAKIAVNEGSGIYMAFVPVAKIQGDLTFSYDRSANQYYLSLNTDYKMSYGSSDFAADIKSYVDFENINLDYNIKTGDAEPVSGSYYIPMAKLGENLKGTIFDPNGDNVLYLAEDNYDAFLESYEKFYSFFKDKKYEGALDRRLLNIEGIVNRHTAPQFESGKTTVFDREIDADIITQTFTKSEAIELYRELMEEFISAVEETGFDSSELKAQLDSGVGKMKKSIENNPESASEPVTVTHFIDRSNTEIAKCSVDASGKTTVVELTNDGDTAVRVTADNKIKAEFRRSENDSRIVDSLKIDGQPKAEIKYKKTDKAFTINIDGSDILSGTADFSNGEINADCVIDLSPMLSPNGIGGKLLSGQLNLSFSIKPSSEIVPFDGEKNLLSVTVEEFKKLFPNGDASGESSKNILPFESDSRDYSKFLKPAG